VAAAGMAAIAWLSAAGPRGATSALPPAPRFAAVADIVISRCSMCHANEPVWAGLAAPPKGILLDNAERIRRQAHLIDINSVRSHAMPPGNVTEMTGEERRLIAAWLAAGAPAR
jgi:uncharacterized membrane protein